MHPQSQRRIGVRNHFHFPEAITKAIDPVQGIVEVGVEARSVLNIRKEGKVARRGVHDVHYLTVLPQRMNELKSLPQSDGRASGEVLLAKRGGHPTGERGLGTKFPVRLEHILHRTPVVFGRDRQRMSTALTNRDRPLRPCTPSQMPKQLGGRTVVDDARERAKLNQDPTDSGWVIGYDHRRAILSHRKTPGADTLVPALHRKPDAELLAGMAQYISKARLSARRLSIGCLSEHPLHFARKDWVGIAGDRTNCLDVL